MRPQMLWENADPEIELSRRFGFSSVEQAASWAGRLLADAYGVRVATFDRMVISAHNLMLWVGTETAGRLLIKVCRVAAAHDWLVARNAMVGWLADRGLPVAAPLLAGAGRQLLRDGRSVGVQPILSGELLDTADPDQIRAAGSTLAVLHTELAGWPDARLLEPVQPIAGSRDLWTMAPEQAERVPGQLRERLSRRTVDLPTLPRQPIHADFRAANVLAAGDTITGVLDFEEARIDAAVVDLAHAVCLLGTRYRQWQPLSPSAQRLFLDSYTDHRPLTDDERVWLAPLVARGMLGQGWWDEAERWLR